MATLVDPETGEVLEPTELESRAGIPSLAWLQARRRQIIEANARLIAMHGPFGHHDDHRKRMVECQKTRVRLELGSQGQKVTEAMIDQAGYATDAYGAFLDTALEEKVRYLKVKDELDAIEEQIRSREIELQSYNKEIGLSR